MKNIQKYLDLGRYYSAVSELLKLHSEAPSLSKNSYANNLAELLKSSLVMGVIGQELVDESRKIVSGKLNKVDETEFIGKAFFPVHNTLQCGLLAIEVNKSPVEHLLGFTADEKTLGDFYKLLKMFWLFLQRNIKATESPEENDVTVLNWGQRFSLISNPFVLSNSIFHSGTTPQLEGNSFHFAAVVAAVSKIINKPVDPNFVFTGTIDFDEKASKVSFLIPKCELIRRERPSLKKIIIPPKEKFTPEEREFINQNKEIFLEVKDITALVEAVFGDRLSNLFAFDQESRYELGSRRIVAKEMGIKEISFYDLIDDTRVNITQEKLNVVKFITSSGGQFNVFPLKKIYFKENKSTRNLILLEGVQANIFVGNFMSHNPQDNNLYSMGIGTTKAARVFACPKEKDHPLLGKMFMKEDLE
jgi:hypothetical protein